jgi:5-(carboxyamino)imidazole ribonucleotide mutase
MATKKSDAKAKKVDSKVLVGIVMGSQSDWDTMRNASETLKKFGVAHECKVMSAHRSPSLAS